jgi:hypothetical protein
VVVVVTTVAVETVVVAALPEETDNYLRTYIKSGNHVTA